MKFAADLKTLLKQVCAEFRDKELQFCLTGGWAVSLMSTPRATVDIDIFVVLNDDIKDKVLSILKKKFDLVQSHEIELKELTIWRQLISIKGKKELLILDLLNANNNYLKSVIERSFEIEYEGTIIPFISIEDLIIIKLSSFRKQDQADIENLISSDTVIDWEYVEKIVKEFSLDWDYILKMKEL